MIGRVPVKPFNYDKYSKVKVINFHANEGEFSTGNKKIQRVEYSITRDTKTEEITKYSHTPNIDDAGVQQSSYSHNYTMLEVVTIEGATTLNITIKYGGESTSYDWACMWEGNHPEYNASNNYGSSLTGKLGGSDGIKSYTVNNSSVTFGFRTDGSGVGSGYGYYAVIKGTIPIDRMVIDKTKITIPVPSCNNKIFKGWYFKKNEEPFNIDEYEVLNEDYVINLYAKYE